MCDAVAVWVRLLINWCLSAAQKHHGKDDGRQAAAYDNISGRQAAGHDNTGSCQGTTYDNTTGGQATGYDNTSGRQTAGLHQVSNVPFPNASLLTGQRHTALHLTHAAEYAKVWAFC